MVQGGVGLCHALTHWGISWRLLCRSVQPIRPALSPAMAE